MILRFKDNPRRLNYLLWVEDLLGLLPDSDALRAGLDIGAGASAVYSLLGAAHFKWRMVSTEADSSNFEAATENVQNNKLNSSVKIIKVDKSDIFLKAFESNQDFDFSMCNPPFYTKEKKLKDEDIAGIESEVKTIGGEVEFVKKMITESSENKHKVKIYTVLLGHKSSLSPVKHILANLRAASFTTTEFCQGKTMRWGVAWTFLPNLSLNSVIGTKAKKDKQKPYTFTIEKPESLPQSDYTAMALYQRIKRWLEEISVNVLTHKETKFMCSAKISAAGKTWQNQRRMKRERKRKMVENSDEDCMVKKMATENRNGKYSEMDASDDPEDTNLKVEDALLNEILSAEKAQANTECAPEAEEVPESPAVSVLECALSVRWSGEKVVMDLSYLEGEAGRDGVHQLAQFVKNKISSML